MQQAILDFVRKNIVKLCIVGLLLFIAAKKNMRFHINLNSPVRQERPDLRNEPEADQVERKEYYTEEAPTEKQASLIERFQLNIFGRKRKEDEQATTLSHFWQQPIDPEAQDAFIRRFAHVTIAERKKFGIPSSFILANGLLHSRAGYAELVRRGNNYFGLPCTSDWRGATVTVKGKCYRAYETAWMSFRDHSLFISRGPYTPDQRLLATDYDGWITQLIAQGYPVSEAYGEKLVHLIEELQLFLIDEQNE